LIVPAPKLLIFLTLTLPFGLAASEQKVFGFIEKSCTACHNAKMMQGGVNLKIPHEMKTFTEDRDLWEKVAEKVKTGQMPPPGLPKPKTDEVAAVTHWLEGEFLRQDRAMKPNAGRIAPRRLNKAEYRNTIRDLLGVDLQAAADFPADETAYGFDTNADALSLSPVLLEKYVDAAERAVRTAIFGPAKQKPAYVHYSAPVRIAKIPTPEEMKDYDETGLSTLHSAHWLHYFPADGEYHFRLTLNGHRPNDSEPVTPSLYIDGILIHEWEVDATDLEGQIVEVRARVKAGERLVSASYTKAYEGLPPSYGGPNPSRREPLPRITSSSNQNPQLGKKMTQAEIEFFRKYGTRVKTDRVDSRVDNRYESIDIGGPFEQRLGPDPASRSRIFTCKAQTDACAQKIIADFTRKAFRRPVQAEEVDRFLGFYKMARREGESFDESIATALQAILVNPHFLYRIESSGKTPGADEPLNDFELASRLSYFLWSSTPDEPLLRLAETKQLHKPAVLEAQVRRMLADPKSSALVENFAGQWLQFKNMDVVKPDLERFPKFDDGLRRSMRRETALFVEHIFRNNRSLTEMLNADYTFLDERLARYYGIKNVQGPEFRKIDMSTSERGGGLLAHASILTVSSYSTRTSPVLRGKWIMENLLNAPPGEPPAGVPALDDTKIGQDATLRVQMEQHRKNPACASCHSLMDPLGFGLENLDAVGSWRERDGQLPIDAAGELPNGKTFHGPNELKKLLEQDKEDFLRGLATKMLTYALGRGLERFDRPVINRIVDEVKAKNYQAAELVIAIVNSYPFRNRRGPDAVTIVKNQERNTHARTP
jgi:hypothetical protein